MAYSFFILSMLIVLMVYYYFIVFMLEVAPATMPLVRPRFVNHRPFLPFFLRINYYRLAYSEVLQKVMLG